MRDVITGPGAWIGREIQHDESWISQVDAAAVDEIDAALAHVKTIGAAIPFARDAFPLPRLGPALDHMLDEIENGRGFVLLRGIPRARYTDAECELIYWGLGVHLGNPVSQNARGHRLGHVAGRRAGYRRPERARVSNQPAHGFSYRSASSRRAGTVLPAHRQSGRGEQARKRAYGTQHSARRAPRPAGGAVRVAACNLTGTFAPFQTLD